MARRTSFRSEGPNNTRCYQLKDAAQKFSAGVGVELKQIYYPGRRSHHPNSAPQEIKPNPKF
jgi:hypothetical protein